MLIPIKRVFVTYSREPEEMLLNTEYIVKIESLPDTHEHYYKAKSVVIVDNPGKRDGVDIIYTLYDISFIKGLYTKSRTQRKRNNRS